MKANFKISQSSDYNKIVKQENPQSKNLTQEEFEEFIIKSGAAGSFMIFRSEKKDEELGLEEL